MEQLIIRTASEVKAWLKQNQQLNQNQNQSVNFEVCAIDLETVDSKSNLTLSYYDSEIFSLCIYNGEQAVLFLLFDSPDKLEMFQLIKDFLLSTVKILVGHNVKYDLKVMHKFGLDFSCDLYDTMIADNLIDQSREHGLKALAKSQLGMETTGIDEIKNIRTDQFYQYAINDVVWTWMLMERQRSQLNELGYYNLFWRIEMPFQQTLVEMETVGVLVDTEEMKKQEKQLREIQSQEERAILEDLKVPYVMQCDLFGNKKIVSNVNLNSTKQLGYLVFEVMKLPVVEYTDKTHTPSVGKVTIAKYWKTNKTIKHLARYKAAEKLLSSFYESIPEFIDPDMRLRPNFNDIGARTGRLSCSKPNFQQFPKVDKEYLTDFPKLRKCFIASPGYTMITSDYAGQELRILAHVSGDENLIDTFIKGKDLHLDTANKFENLGIPEEHLYEGSPEFNKMKKKYARERNNAKIINFGVAYRKGAFGFSQDFGISEEEAQKILDRYFEAYPSVKRSMEETDKFLFENGYTKTLVGRRRYFEKIEDKYYLRASYREGFNFLIQGFAADMIRIACRETQSFKYKYPHWDIRMLMTVHDEVVYEVKTEYVKEAMEEIKKAFESCVHLDVPIKAELKSGGSYEIK